MKKTRIIYEQNGGEYYGVMYVDAEVEQLSKTSFIAGNTLVELDEKIEKIKTFYTQDDNEDAKEYAHFRKLRKFREQEND